MIEHGGSLRVFSFTRRLKSSGHVYGIYIQTCPDGRSVVVVVVIFCFTSLFSIYGHLSDIATN